MTQLKPSVFQEASAGKVQGKQISVHAAAKLAGECASRIREHLIRNPRQKAGVSFADMNASTGILKSGAGIHLGGW